MARIEVTTHVEAPAEHVWEVLVDWEAQPAWMRDARSVRVAGDRREGEGVTLRCRTAIASLREIDYDLVVTTWQPPSLLAVSHQGPVIQGAGAFELQPTEHGTRVSWWEEFAAPLGGIGEAFATVFVVPRLRAVFRSSLAGLKRRAEHAAPRA